MSEYRDRRPEVPEVGRAVLLPGRGYTPDKPALAAVTETLVRHGWAVREVWWQVPADLTARRTPRWVVDEARTAAAGWADRPLLVGKSLGTHAARFAARQGLDAVWLTPLLLDRAVVRAMRGNPARQLLVGGTADTAAWDGAAARSTGADVLELPDADHGLVVKGEPARTAAYRDRLRTEVGTWLARRP